MTKQGDYNHDRPLFDTFPTESSQLWNQFEKKGGGGKRVTPTTISREKRQVKYFFH